MYRKIIGFTIVLCMMFQLNSYAGSVEAKITIDAETTVINQVINGVNANYDRFEFKIVSNKENYPKMRMQMFLADDDVSLENAEATINLLKQRVQSFNAILNWVQYKE